MLSNRETATVLAALLFWKEEVRPHGRAAMRPYFERLKLADVQPLSDTQISQLSKRLIAQLRK